VEIPPTQQDISPLIRNGTFSSGNRTNIVNTTEDAAKDVWWVIQAFFNLHPGYAKCAQNLHIFGEGYAGRYVPSLVEHILDQNNLFLQMKLNIPTTFPLQVKSIGIVNGAIDLLADMTTKLRFAVNNTYDHNLLLDFPGLETYLRGNSYFQDKDAVDFHDRSPDVPGFLGKNTIRKCLTSVKNCNRAVNHLDIKGEGTGLDADWICTEAVGRCKLIDDVLKLTKVSEYDIAESSHDPFPSRHWVEYLNQPQVLQALGSPVNFTHFNRNVRRRFLETGDLARATMIPKITRFLQQGIRVGLMYGDRDFSCQWFGGEETSLQIAKGASPELGNDFASAGYAPIVVNETYIGGDVRQYGNLSFSRIFQAGHALSAYQPETAFRVFERLISGKSVSNGGHIDLSTFSTHGPPSSDHRDTLPERSEPVCFVRDFEKTCDVANKTTEDLNAGEVINGVWYASVEDWPLFKHPVPLSPQSDVENLTNRSSDATEEEPEFKSNEELIRYYAKAKQDENDECAEDCPIDPGCEDEDDEDDSDLEEICICRDDENDDDCGDQWACEVEDGEDDHGCRIGNCRDDDDCRIDWNYKDYDDCGNDWDCRMTGRADGT
jgi:carboxypeptidase C (cathepsin A)